MQWVHILLGAVILLLGRSLFWAFVAIAGFLVGVVVADAALAQQAEMVRLLVAIGAGVLGAVIAVLAQRIGFALGGFYAGGYLGVGLANLGSPTGNLLLWFLAGGAIGAIVAALIMDWAIIVLSSLVGAGAIVAAIQMPPAASIALFVVLAAAGIAVQTKRLRGRRRTDRDSSHHRSDIA